MLPSGGTGPGAAETEPRSVSTRLFYEFLISIPAVDGTFCILVKIFQGPLGVGSVPAAAADALPVRPQGLPGPSPKAASSARLARPIRASEPTQAASGTRSPLAAGRSLHRAYAEAVGAAGDLVRTCASPAGAPTLWPRHDTRRSSFPFIRARAKKRGYCTCGWRLHRPRCVGACGHLSTAGGEKPWRESANKKIQEIQGAWYVCGQEPQREHARGVAGR